MSRLIPSDFTIANEPAAIKHVLSAAPLSVEQIKQIVAIRHACQLQNEFRAKSAKAAVAAGRLLNKAKADCQHGQWLPFLKEAKVNRRTASRWMRLADLVDSGAIKWDTVSHLGLARSLWIARNIEWWRTVVDLFEVVCVVGRWENVTAEDLEPAVYRGVREDLDSRHGSNAVNLACDAMIALWNDETADMPLPEWYLAIAHAAATT